MTYEEGQARWRKLRDKHGLHDWHLSIENLRNPMFAVGCSERLRGLCDFPNKTIRIDYRLSKQFRQTLLHEIAHALVPNDPGHGEEWQRKACEIGCTVGQVLPHVWRAQADERLRGGEGD